MTTNSDIQSVQTHGRASLRYRCPRCRCHWNITPGQPAAAMAILATCVCGKAGIPVRRKK